MGDDGGVASLVVGEHIGEVARGGSRTGMVKQPRDVVVWEVCSHVLCKGIPAGIEEEAGNDRLRSLAEHS